MEVARLEKEARVRREKSARAVALALEGKWEEAAALNRELLELFPEDVEALNRLGKASLELGQYLHAREAFAQALVHSPHNSIAKKNLERLAQLHDKASLPMGSPKVAPNLFIAESCKSGMITLWKPASRDVLAKMAAGDPVTLRCQERRLLVENIQDEYLGEVEPKLATRLIRFINGGNRYVGAVISIHHQDIAVTLREVYTDPQLMGVCSFPSTGTNEPMAYLRDAFQRFDLGAETEEEDLASGWTDSEDAIGEEIPQPIRASQESSYDDDEEEEE